MGADVYTGRGGPTASLEREACWPRGRENKHSARESLILSRAVACHVVPRCLSHHSVACMWTIKVPGSWHGIQGTWARRPMVNHRRIGPELSATESPKKPSLLVLP